MPRLPEQAPTTQVQSRRFPLAAVAAVLTLVFGIASVAYVFGIRPASTAATTTLKSEPAPSLSPTLSRPTAPETTVASPRSTGTVTVTPSRRETTGAATDSGPSTVCTYSGSGEPNPEYPFSFFLSTAVADTSDSEVRAAVSSIQEVLRAAGYKNRVGGPVYVDGIFGPATAFSVRSFQVDNALTVDGKVGPETWRALSEYC